MKVFPHETFYAVEIYLGNGSLSRCFGCGIRIGYLLFYIALCFYFSFIILKLLSPPALELSERSPANTLELKSSDRLKQGICDRCKSRIWETTERLLLWSVLSSLALPVVQNSAQGV
jgi:hypothetical protein